MPLFIYTAALLLFISALAEAQDTCSCSPTEFTFELKLDEYTCPDPPFADTPDDALAYFGSGVQSYACAGPDSTQIPVKIIEALFESFDQEFNLIDSQSIFNLTLTDGESLTFTSPKTNPPAVRAILFGLIGEDQNGEPILTSWVLFFTNECGVLALQDGTKFGWVVFVSLFDQIKTGVCFFW